MSWEPILDGEVAGRARDILRVVCDGLAELSEPAADLALFWSYAAQADFLDAAAIAARLDAAYANFASSIERGFDGLALYGGLSNSAWVAAHVASDVDEFLNNADQVVLDELDRHERWPGRFDLVGGLVGYGVYFLERGDAPTARRGVQRVVEHLAALSVDTATGATWFTRPEWLDPDELAHWPQGCFKCGLTSGVAGVIALLTRIGSPEALALRDRAASWMRAQLLDDGQFPVRVDATRRGKPALGATHGVAIGMWGTASLEELASINRVWMTQALPVEADDASVAAAFGHACNRFYQATKAPEYRDAAQHWLGHALDLHAPGRGIGGFSMKGSDGDYASADLIHGTVGVGLTLLSAISVIEPAWDRVRLLDPP